MKNFRGALAVAATLVSVSSAVIAGVTNDIVTQEISTQCTTRPTGGDGRRHGCQSDWVKLTVPSGYVINKDASQVRVTSGAGSHSLCHQRFSGEVEVVAGTGLMAPTVTEIQADARGPSGHWAGRGWAHCKADVVFTKIR